MKKTVVLKMSPRKTLLKANKKCATDEFLNCDQCEYKCKKESALQKHNKIKHEGQSCKVCKDAFPTSQELLIHVADQHTSNTKVIRDIKAMQEKDGENAIKCAKCNKVIPKDDHLIIHKGADHDICILCTI